MAPVEDDKSSSPAARPSAGGSAMETPEAVGVANPVASHFTCDNSSDRVVLECTNQDCSMEAVNEAGPTQQVDDIPNVNSHFRGAAYPSAASPVSDVSQDVANGQEMVLPPIHERKMAAKRSLQSMEEDIMIKAQAMNSEPALEAARATSEYGATATTSLAKLASAKGSQSNEPDEDDTEAKRRATQDRNGGITSVGATATKGFKRGLRRAEENLQAKQEATRDANSGTPVAGAAITEGFQKPMDANGGAEATSTVRKESYRSSTMNENIAISSTARRDSDQPVRSLSGIPEWTSQMPPPQPLPPVAATSSQRPLPGAYAVGTLAPFALRHHAVQDSAQEESTDVSSSCASDIEEGGGVARENGDTASVQPENSEVLTEATPVDFEDLAQAMPVDFTKKIKRRQQQQSQHWGSCVLMLSVWFAALAVVATVVGLLIRNRGGEESGTLSSSSAPSTLRPSTSPTTAAPTSVLENLLGNLPEVTLESLKDPFSPQTQAYDWLAHHQNVSNLPEWRKIQLFALACFYFSFGGPEWPKHMKRSWLDDTVDECNWFSSNNGHFHDNGTFHEGHVPQFEAPEDPNEIYDFCNRTTGEVEDISLDGLGLAGSQPVIPPEIALLTSLKFLYIFESDFHGKLDNFIPSDLYQMTSLEWFGVYETNLTGQIPSEFGLFTNLKGLALDTNKLTGTIPNEISSLVNLETLHLYSNFLTGTIATELGLLTNMYRSVEIDDNHLTGTLPTELGSLTGIRSLWFGVNEITGVIPSELGNLSELDTLKAHKTDIGGSIPSQLGLLTKLARLDLNGLPFLTGSIPTELGGVDTLTQLNFTGTSLTGTFPQSFCSLQESTCAKESATKGQLDCFLDFECGAGLCGCGCECSY